MPAPSCAFRTDSTGYSVARVNGKGSVMHFPAKKRNVDFRDASRREDAAKLRAAFDGRTQSEMANKGARALGVSPRQIINWMQMEHDMPSWAVKAVSLYLDRIEAAARKIEGHE